MSKCPYNRVFCWVLKPMTKWRYNPTCDYCWWFRNPANSPVEVGSFSPWFSAFLHISGGCLGRKKTINSSRGSCCWISAPNKTSPIVEVKPSQRHQYFGGGWHPSIWMPWCCWGKCPNPLPHTKKRYIILYTNNICRIILLNIYIYLSFEYTYTYYIYTQKLHIIYVFMLV